MVTLFAKTSAAVLLAAFISVVAINGAAAQGSVYQGTLGETNQKTAEVNTEEVRRILAEGPHPP